MVSRMTSAPCPSVASRTTASKSSVAVVDEDRRPELAAHLELLRGPGSHRHPRPDLAAQLDGHRPDPRAAAVDEQDLAGLDVRRHEDVGPDGAGDLRQGRGVLEADPGRDREQLARRHGDLLRIPTAGQQRADLVPDGPAVDAVAELRDTPAHLETRVCRRAGRRVVVPLSLHDVRPVHPGGDHLDDDLTGPGHRVGHVVEDEGLGSTGLRERDRLHVASLWRAAASASGVSTSRASASSTATVVCARASSERAGHPPADPAARRAGSGPVGGEQRVRRVRRGRRPTTASVVGSSRRVAASVRRGIGGERHVAGEDDDQIRVHQRQSGGDRGDRPLRRRRLPRPSDARRVGRSRPTATTGHSAGRRVEEMVEDGRRAQGRRGLVRPPSRAQPPRGPAVASRTTATGDGTGQSASATQAVPTRRNPTDSYDPGDRVVLGGAEHRPHAVVERVPHQPRGDRRGQPSPAVGRQDADSDDLGDVGARVVAAPADRPASASNAPARMPSPAVMRAAIRSAVSG